MLLCIFPIFVFIIDIEVFVLGFNNKMSVSHQLFSERLCYEYSYAIVFAFKFSMEDFLLPFSCYTRHYFLVYHSFYFIFFQLQGVFMIFPRLIRMHFTNQLTRRFLLILNQCKIGTLITIRITSY